MVHEIAVSLALVA